MANTHAKTEQITYERLYKALAQLGFVRKTTDTFTAFRETAHDAWIVLPRMEPSRTVGDPHLVTIRNTVIGRGVASAEKLESLLGNPHPRRYITKSRGRVVGRKGTLGKPRKPATPQITV